MRQINNAHAARRGELERRGKMINRVILQPLAKLPLLKIEQL